MRQISRRGGRVPVDVPQRVVAVLQRGHGARRQVDHDAGDHHGPVLEQVLVAHDPSVSFACPELDQQSAG